MAQLGHRREGTLTSIAKALYSPSKESFQTGGEASSMCLTYLLLHNLEQELGLPISDEAITQMKANLDLDEEQMKVAAVEEKKRRREYQNSPQLAHSTWTRISWAKGGGDSLTR